MMGDNQAWAFSELVDSGVVSLESAIHWQLTVNHYPALPLSFVRWSLDIVLPLANSGQFDKTIELPAGVLFRGSRTITVIQALNSLHLWPFVLPEDDYE
jgi:hypothetical protein